MASIPRIIVVDANEQIAEVVRGAMMLLNRRCILVEIPEGEVALEELSHNHADLLIAAYSLPDLTGLELASRAVRLSAGTPVIILANSSDPEVTVEELAGAPYTYLTRPVGEQFVRALRIGLDGEAAVAVQEGGSEGGSALELGPIPDLDLKMIQDHLMTMMRDTGAIGAIVSDRLGRVVHSEGGTGYFDKDVLAAILGPAFARTVDLRELLGGNAWSLQFFDGDKYDVFGLALGLHYFVALIFEGEERPAYGPVTRYGRGEAESIIEKMGDEAWSFRRAARKITQSMQPVSADSSAEAVSAPAQPAQSDVDLSEAPTQPMEPVDAPPPSSLPELKFEPVADMDVDSLFGQSVDESAFEDLFSEDETEQSFLSGSDMVSFDDAMNMGILDE